MSSESRLGQWDRSSSSWRINPKDNTPSLIWIQLVKIVTRTNFLPFVSIHTSQWTSQLIQTGLMKVLSRHKSEKQDQSAGTEAGTFSIWWKNNHKRKWALSMGVVYKVWLHDGWKQASTEWRIFFFPVWSSFLGGPNMLRYLSMEIQQWLSKYQSLFEETQVRKVFLTLQK